MKGLEQRRFSIELGQRSTEFKLYLIEVRRVNTIIPSSTWVGALVPGELRDILSCIALEEELGLCFITHYCLTAFSLFL